METGGEGGQEGWGREVKHRTDFFYVDDGLIELIDPVWLQGELDTLPRMF